MQRAESMSAGGNHDGRHTVPPWGNGCAGHDVRKKKGNGRGASGDNQLVAVIDVAAVDDFDSELTRPAGRPGADAVVYAVVVLGDEVVVLVVDVEVEVGVAVAIYRDAGLAVGAEGVGPGVGVVGQHLVVKVDARADFVVGIGGGLCGMGGGEGAECDSAGGEKALGHHGCMPWSVSGATSNGYCFVVLFFVCLCARGGNGNPSKRNKTNKTAVTCGPITHPPARRQVADRRGAMQNWTRILLDVYCTIVVPTM